MHTVAPESVPESLLDEADFLAELSSLEHGLAEKPRPRTELLELSTPARTTAPGKFFEPVGKPAEPAPSVEEEDNSPVVGRLAAAGMFVLMMGVGAAGAMLVYHERVARILATLRI